MVKKSKNKNSQKSKVYINKIILDNKRKKVKNDKRPVRKKILDEKEFITDLSFIDKYEEEEKNRLLIKEKENNIKNRNRNKYKLKLCYRQLTNNIELIGNQIENNNDFKNILLNKNANKCCYLLNKDNYIIVPFNINEYLNNNIGYKHIHDKGKIKFNENKSDNGKIFKKKLMKKYRNKLMESFFYLHINKKNLINCILLNDSHVINYINMFLSGNYTGYFEENKNNKTILNIDSFNIYLNKHNYFENKEYHNFDVIGKGKDEHGEYIIKGEINLIKDLNQFTNENKFSNDRLIDNKVINFGEMSFNKIYGL